MMTEQLVENIERWSAHALAQGWVEEWVEGAIFPSELVFLISWCQTLELTRILESGRQDGYSTEMLAQYTDSSGGRLLSVDMELDPDRAAACRRRLAGHTSLDLYQGNAFDLVGRLVRHQADRPLAVVMDGPKGFFAMTILLAAAGEGHVHLIAQHNINHGSIERRFIRNRAGSALQFLEDLEETGPTWDELRRRERDFCKRQEAVRDLDHSTLAVIPLDGETSARLVRTMSPSFFALQPRIVRMLWRLGLYRMMPFLFKVWYWLTRRLRTEVGEDEQ